MVDPLNEQGLRAYRSTDASTWTPQPKLLLAGKGVRQDDGNGGSHADVVRKKVGSRQKKKKSMLPTPLQRRACPFVLLVKGGDDG